MHNVYQLMHRYPLLSRGRSRGEDETMKSPPKEFLDRAVVHFEFKYDLG